MPQKFVILLDGPIGAGKTTLGRALALRFNGTFLDGDDHKAKGKPWYGSSLSTCRALRNAGIAALHDRSFVFIGRPMRCLEWIYFKNHFEQIGVGVVSIGLQASFENITRQGRGRSFSAAERKRIPQMICEGYGARPYSDFQCRTDQTGLQATTDMLEANLRTLCKP